MPEDNETQDTPSFEIFDFNDPRIDDPKNWIFFVKSSKFLYVGKDAVRQASLGIDELNAALCHKTAVADKGRTKADVFLSSPRLKRFLDEKDYTTYLDGIKYAKGQELKSQEQAAKDKADAAQAEAKALQDKADTLSANQSKVDSFKEDAKEEDKQKEKTTPPKKAAKKEAKK